MARKAKKLKEGLGNYVRAKYKTAFDTKRADVYDTLIMCLRQLKGESLDCNSDDTTDVDVGFNITAPIVRGVVSLIRDVLANAIDDPYELQQTPVVDLDDESKKKLEETLNQILPSLVEASGGDPEIITTGIQSATQTTKLAQNKKAALAVEQMAPVIKDRLLDANWRREFSDFIYNFVLYPTAILKAPAVESIERLHWNGTKAEVITELVRRVENISPFNFYPAPKATSIEDAEFVCERRRVNPAELMSLSQDQTYSTEGILEVFTKYPEGFAEENEDSSDGTPPEVDDQLATDDGDSHVGYYDCVGFYGRIASKYLQEYGIDGLEDNITYEAEVWVIDNIVIKALLNPDVLGRRPFYVASFEPVPNTIWGFCPVTRLTDVQRICNAVTKALVVNLGYSSGIMGEVDIDRIDDDDDPRVLSPNQLRPTRPDTRGTGKSAITFYNLPNHSASLLSVHERFLEYAYEVIGIPRIAFGGAQGLGTIGRTSGGVAMVLNQSAKAIKFALHTIEQNVIEPVVQSFVDWELLYNEDPSIKGDIHVYARGVSGVIERESKSSNMDWAIQSIASIADKTDANGQLIIPPDATARLLYEKFKLMGIPTEGIFPNYDLQSAAATDAGISPMDMRSQLASPEPSGMLDGRSGAAIEAINTSNGLEGQL